MDKIIELIIEYLRLDEPWIPDCEGNFSLTECCGGDMGGCKYYDICKREIEIREKLKLLLEQKDE